MLIAACNGCPCARPAGDCTCNDVDRIRYARRLSGPLLDRIDLVCELSQPPPPVLTGSAPAAESSSDVRKRVEAARAIQTQRPAGTRVRVSKAASARAQLWHLSGRGQDRVLRLARTIADLAESEAVEEEHLDEAIGYRLSDPLRTAA
jgi:magnesium chelatase family protein